jgi:hypothetical protein
MCQSSTNRKNPKVESKQKAKKKNSRAHRGGWADHSVDARQATLSRWSGDVVTTSKPSEQRKLQTELNSFIALEQLTTKCADDFIGAQRISVKSQKKKSTPPFR